MKKIICALLICAVSAIIITGCSAASNRETSTNTTVNTIGNTSGNIANWGYAALQGDWIYYSDTNDSWKLNKIKTDGTGRSRVQ